MTKEEKSLIIENVSKSFLRVVKNHNYYPLFKHSFLSKYLGKTSNMSFDLKNKNYYQKLVTDYGNNVDNQLAEHVYHGAPMFKQYEYIMNFINIILKTWLEDGGVHPRKMGMLGQELFDLVCYNTYGEQYFIDLEQMNQHIGGGVRAPKNDKEAWLMAEYEQRRRHGENINFEDFIHERTNCSDEEFWNPSNLEALDELEYTDIEEYFGDDD